jgi:hypothetical protein
MSDIEQASRVPTGRMLGGVLAVAALWVLWGLVRHPGFQPAPWLRIAAPVVALAIGGGFTRLLALARSRTDGEREFDRGGKALFMGFAMVAATFVAWLLVSQALPSTVTALGGVAASEAGVVSHRVAATDDADCRFRIVVASVAPESGAVPRPFDECVPEAVWRSAAEGGLVMLQLVKGVLGAELVGVAAAQ